MAELKAQFKSTQATTLEVTDTATVANLKVQAANGSDYKDILFNPGADFSKTSNYNDNYIPTIAQVVAFINAQNKASLQIYDLTTTTTADSTTLVNNLTLSDSVKTSGIYFKPHISIGGSQTGYFTTDDVNVYNGNRLTPQSESGTSNLKTYYLTNVTIASGKSLTVYNQGTMTLAHDSESTAWSVTVSADGNTITFA